MSEYDYCPFCHQQFHIRGLGGHKLHCKEKPDSYEPVTECSNCHTTENTDGWRRGLCAKCYQYQRTHGEPRPLISEVDAKVDAEIARLRAAREDAEAEEAGRGMPGKLWIWTVRVWDICNHRYVDAGEIDTVLLL